MAKLLGEAVVLTVMLGSALKIDGRFILQTKTDGPVRMLVVDFTAPGKVRACAGFDKDRVAAAIAAGKADAGALLGHGHLAMTIDQGPDMNRYQGLVALARRLAGRRGARIFPPLRADPDAGAAGGGRGTARGSRRRQPSLARRRHLAAIPAQGAGTRACCRSRSRRCAGRHVPHTLPEDDAWVEGRALVSTVEDVELIDPALSSERLVYRLFHEPGVRVFRGSEVRAECSCSRASVEAMLKSFSQDDRDHMVEDGKISVTCEFCSANYVFAPGEVEAKAG